MSIHDALLGKLDLERMLRDRMRAKQNRAPKVKVETQIHFDNTCSAHSTLVEVIAQDQPGLLCRISSQFAREKCNIEIALIDTGRADGDRRVLPYVRRREAQCRTARAATGGAAC